MTDLRGAVSGATTVFEDEEQLAREWSAHSDRGAGAAITMISSGTDCRRVALAAGYLALLPGLHAEKERLVESMVSRGGEWSLAVVDLVRFLSSSAVDRIIRLAFSRRDDRATDSVLFEIARFFPAHLQPFVEVIGDPIIGEALLTGGPDPWAVELARRFEQGMDSNLLMGLARMRTEAAKRELKNLLTRASAGASPAIDAALENCGVFSESGAPSYHPHPRLGFIVQAGESPHRVGGPFQGTIPFCELCGTSAIHVITVDARSVGWSLSRNPSFFWFSCACHERDPEPLFVRLTDSGAERLVIIEVGTAHHGESQLIPGERALFLVEHPNQLGIGCDRLPNRGLHDLGGPPNWCRMEGFPRCPECGAGMRYVAALDGGLTPFGRIRLSGTLYFFWCDTSQVAATRFQK